MEPTGLEPVTRGIIRKLIYDSNCSEISFQFAQVITELVGKGNRATQQYNDEEVYLKFQAFSSQ